MHSMQVHGIPMKTGKYAQTAVEAMDWDIYSVGRQIREYRDNTGLTGKQLADLCEVTPAYIYQVENGMIVPSLNLIRKVSMALKIHPRDLIV